VGDQATAPHIILGGGCGAVIMVPLDVVATVVVTMALVVLVSGGSDREQPRLPVHVERVGERNTRGRDLERVLDAVARPLTRVVRLNPT
jgi:hypothetical protein